jgi:ABC-type Fe3+/spermidine/putrescine transport system ATPase subunit
VRDLLLAELRRFAGVRVLVTHDPVEAMTLADRLVLLEDGRVTQIGTPQEIRDAPRSPYAADLVGVNAFRGRIERLDGGAGGLVTDHGEVVVPWPDVEAGAMVLGLLRPADVTLSTERPIGSARNAFPGRVSSIAIDGDRARVRLATEPPIVGSIERLGIREGREVWASFKAVEVRTIPL